MYLILIYETYVIKQFQSKKERKTLISLPSLFPQK